VTCGGGRVASTGRTKAHTDGSHFMLLHMDEHMERAGIGAIISPIIACLSVSSARECCAGVSSAKVRKRKTGRLKKRTAESVH
jgi:hypothetical protein